MVPINWHRGYPPCNPHNQCKPVGDWLTPVRAVSAEQANFDRPVALDASPDNSRDRPLGRPMNSFVADVAIKVATAMWRSREVTEPSYPQ